MFLFSIANHFSGEDLNEDDEDWIAIRQTYEQAVEQLHKAVSRLERKWNTSRTKHSEEMDNLRKFLPLRTNSIKSEPNIKCYKLPAPRNEKFFGRENELLDIRKALEPGLTGDKFASLCIHGLGGVGKSQIALHFALNLMADLDVILWVNSETTTSLEQSFSEIAVKWLKLEGASEQNDAENRFKVLKWLQSTGQLSCPQTPIQLTLRKTRSKVALDL